MPGEFYIENGICLCYMMPEIEAAELMGFDHEAMHCYFKQQRLTSEELEHAIAAVAASDIQGLRYAGSNKYVLGRLVELGQSLAAMLGHSRIQMVLRYTHPTEEHQFAAMKGRLFFHQKQKVIKMAYAYLLIEPYKEKQSFVQQAIDSLLKMLGKIESAHLNDEI